MANEAAAQVMYQVVQRPANADKKTAAAFLGICEKSVDNLALDPKVLKKIKIGRRSFFRWSELERLAKDGAAVKKREKKKVAKPEAGR